MTTVTEESRTFSRRTIVKGAGAIVVALGVPGLGAKAAHAAPTVVTPTRSTRGSRSARTAP